MDLYSLKRDIAGLEALLLARYRQVLLEHGALGREILGIKRDTFGNLLMRMEPADIVILLQELDTPIFHPREGASLEAAMGAVLDQDPSEKIRLVRVGLRADADT